MRHVTLTCKHHPNLRWSCKSIAFSPGYGYNASRHIFFNGKIKDSTEHPDSPVSECSCPTTDLVLAPEDEWGMLSIEQQKAAVDQDSGGY